MGNQVIFAVHHDEIDTLKETNTSFVRATDEHMMSAWVPRLFKESGDYEKRDRYHKHQGIVTSCCFHSSQDITFYINSQGLFYSSLFSFVKTNENESIQDSIIKEMEHSKNFNYNLESLKIYPSNEDQSQMAGKGKVSIFGFLTDDYSPLSDEEDFMKRVATAIKLQDWSILPKRIRHITEIDNDESAFVTMGGNTFKSKVIPYMNIETAIKREHLPQVSMDEYRYTELHIINQLSIQHSILKGLGYKISK